MSENYHDKLRQHSYESRHDPLRDAVHHALALWDREDNLEKNDLSEEFWAAMGRLRSVYQSVRRGEPEEVPDVEVTYDEPQPTLAGSLVHVEAPERPLERRRSGAKNVSAPEYQNAFISEARASMGQPSRQDAEALIGHVVKLTFNVDWSPVTGVLTHVKDQHGGSPYLLLDDYRERAYPLNAIQRVEELLDHPSRP